MIEKESKSIEIQTSLDQIFRVQIMNQSGECPSSVLFKIGTNENGSDAVMSVDGGITWFGAFLAYHSIKAFEDRFPEAFEDI